MFTMPWIVRLGGAGAVVALAGLIFTSAASAQTTLRLGKAQANQFAFIPADIGVETGIFKKHGIDLEISAFAGDAKMVQALTAGIHSTSRSAAVRRSRPSSKARR